MRRRSHHGPDGRWSREARGLSPRARGLRGDGEAAALPLPHAPVVRLGPAGPVPDLQDGPRPVRGLAVAPGDQHARRRGRRARDGRTQAPLLPLADGPVRPLAGAAQGRDGDGLRSRLRGRDRRGGGAPRARDGRALARAAAAARGAQRARPRAGTCERTIPHRRARGDGRAAGAPRAHEVRRRTSSSCTSTSSASRCARASRSPRSTPPELVATQQEYLLALRAQGQLAGSGVESAAQGGRDLVQAARQRLLFWDMAPRDVEALERTGTVEPGPSSSTRTSRAS